MITLPSPFDVLPKSSLIPLRFKKMAHIFSQENKTNGMYFIKSGSVHLIRVTEQGEEVVIHRAHAGETFAEASIYSDYYHCHAVTQVDTEVVKISKEAIIRMIDTDAKFAIYLTKRFAFQVQNERKIREIMSIRNAEDRVYTGLCLGMLDSSIKLFASQIGLTHESTYRALASLSEVGKITKVRRGIFKIL